jgi:RNA polymerase sigma factor (sigma-70 family)
MEEYMEEIMSEEIKKQPNVEEMMIRMALEELTPRQRVIWELYNFDRFTQEEIAKKFGVRLRTIESTLTKITLKVAKWCKLNRGAYMLMKLEQRINDE